MKTPVRSTILARALASDAAGLPANFAEQVAALAEAQAADSSNRTAAAMCGAFAAMLVVCVLGWLGFGKPETDGAAWLEPLLRTVAQQPWLVIGAAGIIIVHVLTLRRRI